MLEIYCRLMFSMHFFTEAEMIFKLEQEVMPWMSEPPRQNFPDIQKVNDIIQLIQGCQGRYLWLVSLIITIIPPEETVKLGPELKVLECNFHFSSNHISDLIL